ncbi:hypothetical protein QAD02_024226 [Eretmocerus hayati]|uniref:Uncharacterized protein n=1 Tax=Eretmocerus hayati TaxID=131215 RepID=A0ACC2PY13_9HYME|nr:hypothetical protein QAD02_024226 [Eretmocerus hayati]
MSMNTDSNTRTAVQQFYSGQNVLITGGTGFLGKLLIEKLLRSCPDISSIYVLIRAKKGQDAHHRLDLMLDDMVFDLVKKAEPKFRHKVIAISGDCSLPGLGISDEDRNRIQQHVNIVFNVAATVRFDEKIRRAVAININGTKEVLDLSRKITNLRVIIHVSTAYSNCNRMDIDEKFYEPPLSGDNAIKLVQTLNDEKLDAVTQTLLGDFPNTYCLTKCVAEQVVQQYGSDLCIGIFRPAIVISTYQEPMTGWVDNVFGPTGALVGGASGLLRVLHIEKDYTAELVPADLTINALIATAWDVANSKNEDEDPLIYNYTASWTNQVTWGQYLRLACKHGTLNPTMRSMWCYSITMTSNIYYYYFMSFLLHIIPALLIDTGLFVTGRKTRLLSIYKKIHKFFAVTAYFTTHEWNFSNKNTTALWKKLSKEDQDTFPFSMADFDWDCHMERSVRGLRDFIFKDDPGNLPIARKRMKRVILLHNCLKYAFFALALWLLYVIFHHIVITKMITGMKAVSGSVVIR